MPCENSLQDSHIDKHYVMKDVVVEPYSINVFILRMTMLLLISQKLSNLLEGGKHFDCFFNHNSGNKDDSRSNDLLHH